MKFIYMIFVSLFVVGCSMNTINPVWEVHQSKVEYRSRLLKTQNAIFYNQHGDRVYVVATYIHSCLEKHKGVEKFIISFYTDQTNMINDYDITLLDHLPIHITKIDSNDKILNNLSFKAPWNDYYIFEFDCIKQDKLYLIFRDKNTTVAKLYFAKKAKYTLSKSSDIF